MFLTLVGYNVPISGNPRNIPVFNSIYGGYYLSMGGEFYKNDFDPNPDVFTSKIAIQYLFGSQIGWFSLGGRDNQIPNMGIFDDLMD